MYILSYIYLIFSIFSIFPTYPLKKSEPTNR